MIKLNKLKFRNFLSYGNSFTEYDFTGGITRITGVNGSGKCCYKDTILKIEIEDPIIKEKFLNFINKNNT